MEEKDYYLGFSVFSGIGPKRFYNLISHFKSAKTVWEADTLELGPVLGQVFTAKFDTFRKEFSILDYLEKLAKAHVTYIPIFDERYPKLLKEITIAPIGLFVRGNLEVLQSEKTIAIVGTRRISGYGKQVTEMFTQDLVGYGFTIVSGLAFGVDACAHVTTIDNKGSTIAVLGCGVDCCTPRENQRIYDRILDSGGVIVSEALLSQEATKGMFPSRNRIVAGLSLATIVTEGAEDSGALITANYALQFGRIVFGVPGPITSFLSKGPNNLLSKGAFLATKTDDILNHLNIQSGYKVDKDNPIVFASKEEELIGKLLLSESLTFDQIVRKSKLDSSKTGAILSILEIKGYVKKDTNSLWGLTRPV